MKYDFKEYTNIEDMIGYVGFITPAGTFYRVRKMNENAFLQLHPERRKDINSIIHSNKFEFNDEHYIYVYSQKGKEDVNLLELINYAKSFLKEI